VFAQNFSTGTKQIVSFPVGDPNNMTLVGPLTDTLTGMDFDPGANVLWAINFATHTLGTVNPATGTYAQTTLLAASNISAFPIDPVAGTFYVSTSDRYVYSLDPATGEATKLGAGAAAGAEIRALAADCNGRLFALGSNVEGDILYQAHLGVGEPTLIGSAEYSGPTSLEFDNHSGVLYAWFFAGVAVTARSTQRRHS
jgi:DNA-binding beta-propeller fold protein YncE